jgi:putative N6-adenine-specific DNA methylase
MAAMFLSQCGYRGDEPVLDPMCGSGTFVIEAAEIAIGLKPGRTRSFAFEQLRSFDAEAWATMKGEVTARPTALRFFGSDRDAGAVRMAGENAERAGVTALVAFAERPVEDLVPPAGLAATGGLSPVAARRLALFAAGRPAG